MKDTFILELGAARGIRGLPRKDLKFCFSVPDKLSRG